MRVWLGCLVLALTACGGGGDDDASSPATTETTTGTPRTEGTGATFTVPAPPTTLPVTTTTIRLGLPEHFPVPTDGTLTLGQGSSMAQGIVVHGVTLAEVHDWLVAGLADGGYTITSDTGTQVAFTGTGAGGVADLTEQGGEVDVTIALGPP